MTDALSIKLRRADRAEAVAAPRLKAKDMKFDRVTLDPAVMGGKPCIRGLRVTVGTILGLLAVGKTREEILKAYPYLHTEDVDQALAYAAWRVEEREVTLSDR